LLAGLLGAGHAPGELVFTERHPERAQELSARLKVAAVDVPTAAATADVVVVAVKPQDIDPVLVELGPALRPETLVVSLCAGLPTALYEAALPEGTPVVRVMPNTPMVVGEAMSAISPGTHATDEQLGVVEKLLGSVGRVVRVPESQQDAVTALSGSGPAYFFFLVEAMIDAGILLGLPRAVNWLHFPMVLGVFLVSLRRIDPGARPAGRRGSPGAGEPRRARHARRRRRDADARRRPTTANPGRHVHGPDPGARRAQT